MLCLRISPIPVAKTRGSKAGNSRPSFFKLKADLIPETLISTGCQWVGHLPAGRWWPFHYSWWVHRPRFLQSAQWACRCAPRARCCGDSPIWGASLTLGGRSLKAALTPPTARRPGLSPNPDLEAAALNWPQPTGRIKAAAILVAPGLVYLLTSAHPSGTTSSLESALREER